MKPDTRYLFNRNAATHRDAVLRFGVFASMPAGVLALVLPMLLMPVDRTEQLYKIAAAMGIVTGVVVWAVFFGSMVWVYYSLCEMQYHSPAPLEKRKDVTLYVNGEKWKQ